MPGLVAMNPVTAIAFMLLGAALWLLREQPASSRAHALAWVLSAAAGVTALLCLSRLYLPWDLGPDRLLFADKVAGLT
ncbi:MAG TPA: hypothetical protein VI297_00300, partial [Gemmatimonadales bacterium]